jgi:hypothetical protein
MDAELAILDGLYAEFRRDGAKCQRANFMEYGECILLWPDMDTYIGQADISKRFMLAVTVHNGQVTVWQSIPKSGRPLLQLTLEEPTLIEKLLRRVDQYLIEGSYAGQQWHV